MKRPLLWSAAILLVALLLLFLDDDEGEKSALLGPEARSVEEQEVAPALPVPARLAADEESRVEVPAVEPPEEDGEELIEIEEEIEAPPDPVQRGDCVLLIELVDRETGRYVESSVDLWRLGAPGNENWTEGDQLQTSVQVHKRGTTVRELPEGAYRARVTAELQHADDPPAFEVNGSFTQVALEVELPRSHPAYLRVFDENGIEVVEAQYSAAVGNTYHYDQHDVPWRRERRLKSETEMWFTDSEMYSVLEELPFGSVPVRAGPDGFHLGDFRQASRQDVARQRISLLGPQCSRVRLDIDGRAGEPQHFVGVMVRPELVLESLFLPDGSRDPALAERLEILCEARRIDEASPPDSWRELPIQATVAESEKFGELKFTFRVTDLPLSDRLLVPR
jgi:hypothetical protein